jgi:hypothetical protein
MEPAGQHTPQLRTFPTPAVSFIKGWSSLMYEFSGHEGFRTRMEFRRIETDDDPMEWVLPAELALKNIAFAYVDATSCKAQDVPNIIGAQLGTEHPPYDIRELGWLRLTDDMESLAHGRAGMVIIVDNAAEVLSDTASWAFDLIRWWTMQLWHWAEQKRPCHLCFQLEHVPEVRRIYGR